MESGGFADRGPSLDATKLAPAMILKMIVLSRKPWSSFGPGPASGGEHVVNGIARLGRVSSGGFLPAW